MDRTSRAGLAALLSVALLAPLALAHHTPPGLDKLEAGKMACDGKDGRLVRSGAATNHTLPILRTTDNGHLILYANGTANAGREMKCTFDIKITGWTLHGLNPQGAAVNVVSNPCTAAGFTCMTTTELDWWVTFADPVNATFTTQIDILFDLRVDGFTVASGQVRIVEPSVPQIVLF